MNKLGDMVVKHKISILIITVILIIPALIGYVKTKVNYDILVYLPEDIETLKGEKILTDDFNMGAFSVTVVENMADQDLLIMEDKIRKVTSVDKVISIADLKGTTIPLEILPEDIVNKVAKEDSKLLLITFEGSTSDEETLSAVEEIRELTKETSKVGGMSAMVLDTKELFNSEMTLYIIIAVILCIVVLVISLDSYIIPFLLIGNIGVAILFNMGSNIIFGDICYITKAISAVLQLGVTTDFSIFLYHKYEKSKKEEKNKEIAMSNAIHDTLVSVFGSSLTTIAGFLALCTMNLTLGKDIGLVMAKGVLFGLLCVITLFPALLLVFDKIIEKTKHRSLLPKFSHIQDFILKHHIAIFIVFMVLLVPVYLANSKTEVYYNLDKSIPENYGYTMSSKVLKEEYSIVSQEIILLSSNMRNDEINSMIDKIEEIDGVNMVLSSSKLIELGISEEMIPDEIKEIYENDKYKLLLINSTYDIATEELNNQIDKISEIVKQYDETAIIAGEGPLMKDLVTITDEDFHNVNYTSIIIIFLLMLVVLKSLSLPILLVTAIEFAIFINMAVPYFTGTTIPFIASVVIGTIQLGATIDYAILMTTKYLEERKNGRDKKESVKIALDNSITSIIVSGLCFFAATIGVGFVSKIDMISSLCILIARGAIISMIVVIFVVPSILLIFDKIIVKTTLGFKRRKKMKNKIIFVSLVGGFLLTCMPVNAITKEETVYSKLNIDGSLKSTIVSEHIVNDNNTNIIEDKTNLSEIFNTNGKEELNKNGDQLIIKSNGNDIYYQGLSTKDLPISTSITYELNNKKIELEDLLGKKGKVKMIISFTNNDSHIVNENILYTPFVVVTTLTIDNKNNSNITVSNGKVISTGSKSMIAAISSPGLDKSLGIEKLQDLNKVEITFDTKKYESSSFYIVATPKILESEDLDIFDNLNYLYEKTSELSKASLDIQKGAEQLVDGTNTINQYSHQLASSIKILNQYIDTAQQGSVKLDNAVKSIVETLKEKSNSLISENNIEKLQTISTLIETNKISINSLTAANNTLVNSTQTLEQVYSASYPLYDKDGNAILENNNPKMGTLKDFDNETILVLARMIGNDQVITIKKQYESNINLINLLSANNTALEQCITTLKMSEQTVGDTLTTLIDVLTELSNGTNELVIGLSQISDGTKELSTKTDEFSSGIQTLVSGTEELNNGIKNFNEYGLNKITKFVNQDLKNYQDKIDSLISLSENYETFTMKSDSMDGSTKFIMQIDKLKETKKESDESKTVEKKSLWQKIKDLF